MLKDKKRFKKAIALILAVVLCMGTMTACGGSNSGSSAAGKETSNKETSNKSESAAAETGGAESSKTDSAEADTKGGDLITITFPCIWVGTDGKAEVFGQMVDSFNAENEGAIEVVIEEYTDYDAYEDKIRTIISTGDAPDIFSFKSYSDMELYSKSGKLMDLTAYLSDGWGDYFVEGVIDAAQYEGANYSIPYENAVIAIMYNMRLLEEAGVKAIPTNYDEFWEVCEALKGTGVFPAAQMTNDNAWTSMLWYSYALAATGGKDVYEKGLEDPAFVEAAEILLKMFDYTSPDAVGADATVVNGHFFNERAAIYTNGSWILSRIATEGVEGLYDNIELGPGLAYDGGEGGAYVNTVQAYLAAGKQDDPAKEEAIVKFLKYITDPVLVTDLADSSGAIFAINTEVTDETDPLQATMIQQSADAPFMIGTFESEMPTAVYAAFPSALESLVLGEYTPEEFVEALRDAQ